MFIAVGALTACSSKQGETTKSNTEVQTHVSKTEAKVEEVPDTIVYGMSTSPSGVFNPLLTDSIYDDAVCSMVYTSLLKLDEEQNLMPYLAKEYKVSDDKKL